MLVWIILELIFISLSSILVMKPFVISKEALQLYLYLSLIYLEFFHMIYIGKYYVSVYTLYVQYI